VLQARSAFLATLAIAFPIVPALAGSPRPAVAVPGTELNLPFSPAVWSGDLLYLSGNLGNKPGTLEIPGDVVAQTRQTVSNLRRVLVAADMDLSRVVSADIYLSDLREFDAFWNTLREVMPDALPAGAAVEADIALPLARLEMGFVAARPGVAIERVRPEGWVETTSGGAWAVRAGDSLFISGMASFDPRDGKFVGGDLAAQTQRTMRNVGAIVGAAGFARTDLVRCRVFLPDPRDFAAMNEAYGAFFRDAAPPARATVRARLLHPEARVGAQCLAVRGEGRKVVRAEGSAPSGSPFSPAVDVGGRLYLSGMLGRGEHGWGEDVQTQTRITLANLEATLKAAGLSFDDVAEATVYLADIRHYAAMNAVYAETLGTPAPARATVGAPLMAPEALVEIQMTATRKRAD